MFTMPPVITIFIGSMFTIPKWVVYDIVLTTSLKNVQSLKEWYMGFWHYTFVQFGKTPTPFTMNLDLHWKEVYELVDHIIFSNFPYVFPIPKMVESFFVPFFPFVSHVWTTSRWARSRSSPIARCSCHVAQAPMGLENALRKDPSLGIWFAKSHI